MHQHILNVTPGVQAATEQRWEEAERFFQIVLKEEPDSASAYSNMGNVHLSQRQPEQAVLDFSRAIELAPEVSGQQLTALSQQYNKIRWCHCHHSCQE